MGVAICMYGCGYVVTSTNTVGLLSQLVPIPPPAIVGTVGYGSVVIPIDAHLSSGSQ